MSETDLQDYLSLPECIDLALDEARTGRRDWYRWGPYGALRQWGTPREDYSANGDAWNYFPASQAPGRTYRWGDDGLLGLSDRDGLLHFSFAFWNGSAPTLKERLDMTRDPETGAIRCSEEFTILEATPTYSYVAARYCYPQSENEENEKDHFEILIEYAKGEPEDMLIRLTITNNSARPSSLHVLPTLWFRNTWAWDRRRQTEAASPAISHGSENLLVCEHPDLGRYHFFSTNLYASQVIFTDNETNRQALFDAPNATPYVKDAFVDTIVGGRSDRCNPNRVGTRAARHYALRLVPNAPLELHFRLFGENAPEVGGLGEDFEELMGFRQSECREWMHSRAGSEAWQQQASALALTSRQYYDFHVANWIDGDPSFPRPLDQRSAITNQDWRHTHLSQVIAVANPMADPAHASWARTLAAWAVAPLDLHRALNELKHLFSPELTKANGARGGLERDLSWPVVPLEAWALARVTKQAKETPAHDTALLSALDAALQHWIDEYATAWSTTTPDWRDALPAFLQSGASSTVASAWTAVQASALLYLHAQAGDDPAAAKAAGILLSTQDALAAADPTDSALLVPLLLSCVTLPAQWLEALPETRHRIEHHARLHQHNGDAFYTISPSAKLFDQALAEALLVPERLSHWGVTHGTSGIVDALENVLLIEGLLQQADGGLESVPLPTDTDPARREHPLEAAREIAARLSETYRRLESDTETFGCACGSFPRQFDAATGDAIGSEHDAIAAHALVMQLRRLAEAPALAHG